MSQSGVTDAATASAVSTQPAQRVAWRHIAVLAVALLLSAATYGAGVLMPYYADELHRLPPPAVASGAHDPEELWPDNVLVYLAGMFGPLLLPFVASAGAGLGALWLAVLWRRPASQRLLKSVALLVVLAASVAVLLFPLSELGRALTVWRSD